MVSGVVGRLHLHELTEQARTHGMGMQATLPILRLLGMTAAAGAGNQGSSRGGETLRWRPWDVSWSCPWRWMKAAVA